MENDVLNQPCNMRLVKSTQNTRTEVFMSEYWKVTDAARILAVSPETIRQWCANGILPYIQVNRVIRIPKVEFEEKIRQLGKTAAQEVVKYKEQISRSAAVSRELDEILG